ncbi:MAG: ATP-binding protein [Calditrichaceae bacterium]
MPSSKFSAGKYIRSLAKLEKHSLVNINKWDQYGQILFDEWIKDLELSALQFKIARYYFETQFILNNSLDSKIKPLIIEVKDKVHQVFKKIESLKDIPHSELKSRLKNEKHILTKELHTKFLPNLVNVLTQANLEKVINILSNKVTSHLDEFSDLHTIISEYAQKRYAPDFKYDKINFKELIQFEIMGSSSGMTDIYADSLNTKLEQLKRKISNIDQIVEYNLETAIDMLDDEAIDKTDEAHQVAISGLERTLINLDDINEDLDTFLNNATTQITSIATDLQQDIQKLGDNEHILQLRIRLARAQSREKITKFRNVFWNYIKTIIPKVWRILLKSIRKIKKSYRQVQHVSGLSSSSDQREYAFFDFIAEYKNKFKQLPFIYQHLFSTEPLDDQRFFIGRTSQYNKIQSVFKRFQSSQPTSIAIIGEKGNGKTTLVYFACHDIFAGHKIHTIDFKRSIYDEEVLKNYVTDVFKLSGDISFDNLTDSLAAMEGKHIVVLENLHNVFLRTINGFNAIEKLLLMISKLQDNFFWIVTSGQYGWEYLDKVINISSYFNQVIELSSLEYDDIRKLIDMRHKASGYGLNFLSSAKFERNRTYRKLKSDTDKQEYLSEFFFKNLAENSNGNIKVAMQLWLSAIDHVEDENIYIDTVFNLDHRLILSLSTDENFTLAAFIQHEYLTIKEHAEIFHQSEETSDLIINRLYKKGILDINGNNYFISSFVYRPIIKNLRLKNILN